MCSIRITMLEKIRSYIGDRYFKKELHKTGRDRKFTNLQDAKKVGILYNLESVADYEIVSEFVTQLQHDRKEVKALGFVKDKILVSRFLPKLSYDFISRKDVNWFFMPGQVKVRDFISKEFDLLIDLSLKDNLPLRYIAGLSMSLCRIGRFSEKNTDCYDLMIDLPQAASLQEYIRQVTHYLTMINNEPTAE
jgi:hypothetical protein